MWRDINDVQPCSPSRHTYRFSITTACFLLLVRFLYYTAGIFVFRLTFSGNKMIAKPAILFILYHINLFLLRILEIHVSLINLICNIFIIPTIWNSTNNNDNNNNNNCTILRKVLMWMYNRFNTETGDICIMYINKRIVATLYSLEKYFVSGI